MRTMLSIFLMISFLTSGQTLREESRVTVRTAGDDEVVFYAAADCGHCYYYLPTCLRVAVRQSTPEISFVSWNDEETSRPAGGVFHFLVEWGLTPGVEKEVRDIMRAKHDSLAVVMGAALVHANSSESMLEGKDKLCVVLAKSLRSAPAFPTTPGAKMALSFRFTEEEIGDFLYYVNHPQKSRTNLKMGYNYSVRMSSGQVRVSNAVLRLPFSQILEPLK